VLFGAAKPLGGYGAWRLVARLPHTITCMCGLDPRVTPVSIARN
jgi:hypothetical protein